jgi:hypothetical protein
MRNIMKSLIFVAATIGIASCANSPPPQASGKQMTGDEIVAWYMSGKHTETSGTSLRSGNSWTITRDGQGRQTIRGSGGFTDNGTYRMNGDEICNKWQTIRNGEEMCTTLHAYPDGSYAAVNTKGERIATFSAPTEK